MVDGRWMEEGGGGEGQWNRRVLCSQRIGSRFGSFNFIPFFATPYRFTFSNCYRVKHPAVYDHLFFPPYGFETPFAQIRSIKVREFLFARKSNPFAFRGNIIEKHCKRISIYAFVCFEMINMWFFFLELESRKVYFFFHKKNLRKKRKNHESIFDEI